MIYLVFSKIWFSLWQSLLTVFLCLVLGGGLALGEYNLKIKSSKIFNALMALPIFLPSVIVATGFIVVWGNAGYVNNFLVFFGIEKIKFLYSAKAIIAAHCFYNIPLAYLAVQTRLSSMHNDLEELSLVLGANKKQTFLKITWPRLKNTVIGSGVLIFLYSFLSFAIPLILGGIKYQTLEVYIYNLITQQLNFKAALILSSLQFLFLLILIIIFFRYLKSVNEEKINIKQKNYKQKLNFIFIIIYIFKFLLLFFILTPLIAIILKGFNFDNLSKLINLGFGQALARSFFIATVSLLISLIICFLLIFKKNKKFKFNILLLALSPVSVGFIFLLLFGKSLLIMPVVYLIFNLPLAYYLLFSLWEARPKNFIDSLKILGVNNWQKTLSIARYLLPAVLKTLLLGYALVLGDIAISSLLAPFQKPTAMSLSYGLLGNYRFSLASTGLSLVLIFIFIIMLLLIKIFSKYDSKRF